MLSLLPSSSPPTSFSSFFVAEHGTIRYMSIPLVIWDHHPFKLCWFQVDRDTNNSVVTASLKPHVHWGVGVSDINIVLLIFLVYRQVIWRLWDFHCITYRLCMYGNFRLTSVPYSGVLPHWMQPTTSVHIFATTVILKVSCLDPSSLSKSVALTTQQLIFIWCNRLVLHRKLPLSIRISRHPYFTSANVIPKLSQVIHVSLSLSSENREVPTETHIAVLPEQQVVWVKAF